MPDTPPTAPGALPSSQPLRNRRIPLGILIHGGLVFATCFLVPLLMKSNIWPIAGVFWSVITIPVAAGTGALTGWLLKHRSTRVATAVLMSTGLALAVAVGIVMANNR